MLDLAKRVANARRADNALDVECEVALFEPCDRFAAIHANSAGSKVIYTRVDGSQVTFRAADWTMASQRSRTVTLLQARHTAAALRARHALALSKGSDV